MPDRNVYVTSLTEVWRQISRKESALRYCSRNGMSAEPSIMLYMSSTGSMHSALGGLGGGTVRGLSCGACFLYKSLSSMRIFNKTASI